jgi:hypothetical protein
VSSLGYQLCQTALQTSEYALVKQFELDALGVTEYAAAKLPAEVTLPKHPRNLVTTAVHQDLLYKTPDLIGAQRQLRPNKVGSCQGW